MAKISKYGRDTFLDGTELLLGTDTEESNETKNYKLEDVKEYVLKDAGPNADYELKKEALISVTYSDPLNLQPYDTPIQVPYPSAISTDNSVSIDNQGVITNGPDAQLLEIDFLLNVENQSPGTEVLIISSMDPLGSSELFETVSVSQTATYGKIKGKILIDAQPNKVINHLLMMDSTSRGQARLSSIIPINTALGVQHSIKLTINRITVEKITA